MRIRLNIWTDDARRQIHIGRACLDFLGDTTEPQLDQKPDITALQMAVQNAYEIFPPTPQTLPVLESIARAIQAQENILLECMPDVEPEDYVHFFSTLLGRPLRSISFSRGMHIADIIGGLKPLTGAKMSANAPLSKRLAWVDGPLTAAIRAGEFILLRGLEAAEPELVEKLNMLLDDAQALSLPAEAGENQPLPLAPSTRIFALKFFRSQRSTPSISRAFRNRFSAFTIDAIHDEQSLAELCAHFLGLSLETPQYEHATSQSNGAGNVSNNYYNNNGSQIKTIKTMTQFHCLIRQQAAQRQIGGARLQPYEFGLTNLRRWCQSILNELAVILNIDSNANASVLKIKTNAPKHKDLILQVIRKGAELAYTNEIADSAERQMLLQQLEQLFQGVDLQGLWPHLVAAHSVKKKILQPKGNASQRTRWWNQKKHWRKANTSRFKPRLDGQRLKKGININTPETGGNRKEGPNAWYGSDTLGNKGQGEPSGGGGAWGYRTPELYAEFIRKRRNLWNYSIDVSLVEFMETFGSELRKVLLNFDRILEPHLKIERLYRDQGARVDLRRYLGYMVGKSDARIFDRTNMNWEAERLKNVEIIFALNKGRRIFNFEYALTTLAALMSVGLILHEHNIPFSIAGYSDLYNLKQSYDLVWYKRKDEELRPERQNALFEALAQDWHGDTVDEAPVLQELARNFHNSSRTRVLVLLSDFRGFRTKAVVAQERQSYELAQLRRTADELQQQGVRVLGIGLGARSLAEYIFKEHLHITAENFAYLPALLATRISELLHRYHVSVRS